MKNIILLIAALFCFSISYGQETKPTKQETMDWIAGKFKLYTNQSSYDYVNYDNGNIYLKQKIGLSTTMKINLNQLTNLIENKNGLTINGQNGFITYGGDYLSTGIFLYRIDEEGNFIPAVINIDGEKNLLERLKKALDTLIVFNIANSKEKF